MLFFSKGRDGAGSTSTPRETLQPIDLWVKSPSLRIFAEKSYRHFKIGKNLKKNLKKQNGTK